MAWLDFLKLWPHYVSKFMDFPLPTDGLVFTLRSCFFSPRFLAKNK